ncbi:helix-turn-helix transcriptional regulator [Capilliphycus salinus ALCB114379]|uniref:helix-turn-helix transcriptional regulator n=1 Tax=Capilliphycus salinus TaxID=2768948 RepID=UPI0039A696A5
MPRQFELTEREKEVLELCEQGYTPKQIAAILQVCIQRVYNLRQNAKYRLMNQTPISK